MSGEYLSSKWCQKKALYSLVLKDPKSIKKLVLTFKRMKRWRYSFCKNLIWPDKVLLQPSAIAGSVTTTNKTKLFIISSFIRSLKMIYSLFYSFISVRNAKRDFFLLSSNSSTNPLLLKSVIRETVSKQRLWEARHSAVSSAQFKPDEFLAENRTKRTIDMKYMKFTHRRKPCFILALFSWHFFRF